MEGRMDNNRWSNELAESHVESQLPTGHDEIRSRLVRLGPSPLCHASRASEPE